ncbi:MAG TPA: LemA family protein [Candidatus Thermoplasmatota archaeon]|nr:LemA family protein [Candidatus Thermoplasmatota archaeon]
MSFARQYYNDAVLRFNNAVTTFPGFIFAGAMGRTKKQMLEIPQEARNVPKVSF